MGESWSSCTVLMSWPDLRLIFIWWSRYLAHINRSLPVLDEQHFTKIYVEDKSKLPPALLADVYASSLVRWKQSDGRFTARCPNVQYIWNLAVKALNKDFLSPGLPTILAALIDLGGRPITSITGNAMTMGRTVSLAHSLGLNRNPQEWRIPVHEKNMRIRIFWIILIHDWW